MRAPVSAVASLLFASVGLAQDEQPLVSSSDFQPNSCWFIDSAAGAVRGFSIDGTEIGSFNGAGVTPLGIAFGPDGRLYVTSSTGPHDVVAIDNLGTITPFGGSFLTEPRGIAFGPMGRIYVADYAANAIVEFDADRNFVRSIAPPELLLPAAVVVGTDGHLFVSSQGNGKILEIDPENGVVDSVSLDLVASLAIDTKGTLWAVRVTDGVYAFDDDGFTTIAHYQGGSWSNALGLTIGPDFRTWVARGDRIVATTDGSMYDRTIADSTGLSSITACAFAPFHFRTKLKSKAVGSTGKVSNNEFVDIRWAPGSNSASMVFTDSLLDMTDVVSWTGTRHGHFIGLGTFTTPAENQYQFRGVQQRTPARQGGADSLWITLKGTQGNFDEFRPNQRSGTLDITYPYFQVRGTFK